MVFWSMKQHPIMIKMIAIKLNQFTYMRIMNRDYLIKISLTYNVFIIVALLKITSFKRS